MYSSGKYLNVAGTENPNPSNRLLSIISCKYSKYGRGYIMNKLEEHLLRPTDPAS